MAKRRTTVTSSGNYSLVKACAFWGVVLAGVAGLVAFTIQLFALFHVDISWWGRVGGICSMISQIALLISAWLAAWDYVKYKGKAWKIIFWIFFVLAVLGVLGLGISTWLPNN